MTSADASRYGRSTDLPPARPAVAPNGPVTVGSLLRREGRAAHSQDRPVVPRARDAVDDGRSSTHRAAVTAGAFLAMTAVLGTNILGEDALGPGTGADDGPVPGSDRAVVPAPPSPLSLASTAAPLGHAMAVLKAAGSPVLAAMDDTAAGLAPTSGAGIVAQALGGVPVTVRTAVTAAGTTDAVRDVDSGSDTVTDPEHAVDDGRADAHTDHGPRDRSRTIPTRHGSSRTGGSAVDTPPVFVDPSAGSTPPPPAAGGTASGDTASDGAGTASPVPGGAAGPGTSRGTGVDGSADGAGGTGATGDGGSSGGAADPGTPESPAPDSPAVDGNASSTDDDADGGSGGTHPERDTSDGPDGSSSTSGRTTSADSDGAKTSSESDTSDHADTDTSTASHAGSADSADSAAS